MRHRISLTTILAIGLLAVLGAPAMACESGMWVTTDPGSGEPGAVVTVRGGGWEPGSVTLRWDTSAESGGAVLAEAPVASDGTIESQVTIPEGSPGRHMIVAEHTQSAGEVTHSGNWTYFDIPGAAPAQEQAGGEKQPEPKQAEQSDRPVKKADEPTVTAVPSGQTAVVEVPADNAAAPAVATPVEAVTESEKRSHQSEPQPQARPGRFPLEGERGALSGSIATPGAAVEALSVENAPEVQIGLNDQALPWLLAGAIGGLLLVLMGRRKRQPLSTEPHVLCLPSPGSAQDEERSAA